MPTTTSNNVYQRRPIVYKRELHADKHSTTSPVRKEVRTTGSILVSMNCDIVKMPSSKVDYFWDVMYNAGITRAPPDSAIFPQHYRDINKEYVFGQQLGKGTWGVVHRVQKRTLELRKVNIKNYACKTILKSHLDDPILLRREVFNFERCQMADTPHIVKLVDVYEDVKAVHIIMEECRGQELYDEIAAGGLNENMIARIIWQGLTALSYMHEVCHIAHRDLKSSNFLFNDHYLGVGITEEKDIDIRIIDFGLSIHVNPVKEKNDREAAEDANNNDNAETAATIDANKLVEKQQDNKEDSSTVKQEDDMSISENTAATQIIGPPARDPTDSKLLNADGFLTSLVGTPHYTAPEIVCEDHYDFKCDVYSMGVIAYSCLTGGKLPIKGKDEQDTLKLLLKPKKPIDFSDKVWLGYKEEEDGDEEKKDSAKDDNDKISAFGRDFCKLLLQRDPKDRPSAYEAMQHEWLKSRFGYPPPLPQPVPDDLADSAKFATMSNPAK